MSGDVTWIRKYSLSLSHDISNKRIWLRYDFAAAMSKLMS